MCNMEPRTVVQRIGFALAALIAGGVAMTLLRARGKRQPDPDGSTWHQVS